MNSLNRRHVLGMLGSAVAGAWCRRSYAGFGEDSSFSFDIIAGEAIGDRIVRCCREAVNIGPMGKSVRHDDYREFISCGQERTVAAKESLTSVTTSCAMFIRAVRVWCGAPAPGPYVTGTGMFVSMGNVSFSHPGFVPRDPSKTINPGDYFYIASSKDSLDGHTGIFLGEVGPGEFETAEGGGGADGTVCQLGRRKIVGSAFEGDARTLWGWFDCTKVGIPA